VGEGESENRKAMSKDFLIRKDGFRLSSEFILILLFFTIGLFIRLYRLWGPSLWVDEIITAQWIDHSLLSTISILRQWEFPPFYYIILNLWAHVFGYSEWVLRFPSAIFSSLTIIVVYKLGKEIFSEGVGSIAAVLLVFSPFAINYAQDAKMYALFWFLEAASFLFFFRYLKDQKANAYRWYVITSVLSCYTMYTGFLLLAAQYVIVLLMKDKEGSRKWVKGQLVVVLSCAPWIIYFLCSRHASWDLRSSIAVFDYSKFFLRSFLSIIGGSLDHWGKINCFLYGFLITFSLIDILIGSYKNKKTGLPLSTHYYGLLIWLTVPVFIYWFFDRFFFHAILFARYIGFLQIPLILLVGSQINHFNGFIKKVLLVIMVLIAMNNTYLYFKYDLKYADGDWRSTAQEFPQNIGENDIVLSFVEIPFFKYYYKGDTHRFFMLPVKVRSEYFGPVARSSFRGLDAIRGTILDPNNKNGVWEDASPSQVRLKPDILLKEDDIQEIAKGDSDQMLSILIQSYLVKSGIIGERVHSVFILYRSLLAPDIKLNGFHLDRRVSNRGMGYLHFKRVLSH